VIGVRPNLLPTPEGKPVGWGKPVALSKPVPLSKPIRLSRPTGLGNQLATSNSLHNSANSPQNWAASLGIWATSLSRFRPQSIGVLPLAAALLVTLPVFVQAPWVRADPFSATLTTVPILALGILLGLSKRPDHHQIGALLVGFAGSWLGGSLFWGWCRLHPIWHLPVESVALPLALAGLRSRWRLAGAFYLTSLLGTAATDGAIALTGVMELWPGVLNAPPHEAMVLLQAAAQRVLQPMALAVVLGFALVLMLLCRKLWSLGSIWKIGAVALATTLAVDGLFLMAAFMAPRLSGLI